VPLPSTARVPAGQTHAAGHLLSHPPPAGTDRWAPRVIPDPAPWPSQTRARVRLRACTRRAHASPGVARMQRPCPSLFKAAATLEPRYEKL
jgi:hypothetical protein